MLGSDGAAVGSGAQPHVGWGLRGNLGVPAIAFMVVTTAAPLTAVVKTSWLQFSLQRRRRSLQASCSRF